jgi:Mg2+-importing ATPase
MFYLSDLGSRIFNVSSSKKSLENASIPQKLGVLGKKDMGALLKEFYTNPEGLSDLESRYLKEKYGANEIVREKRQHWLFRLFEIFKNPLIILLILLVLVSLFTRDIRTTIVVSVMIAVSVGIRFFQENQAYNAAESLRLKVKTTCTVFRRGVKKEIELKDVVPGDIVYLSAGDVIPADIRIITSKDLFIDQSLLTGESLPVEKHSDLPDQSISNVLEFTNLCFMGTNVESGTATTVVVATGSNTYFGSLAKSVIGKKTLTSFDIGINQFTWLMIRFMAFMVPAVFIVNGLSKGNWYESFLFAASVAVGLTPEMLPALITVNLSKGAIAMSKKKVIVKRLSSIQNFGAMNILCTDKTGTLTQNKVVLIKHININGDESSKVLNFAYLNSLYQTGFKNLMDSAVTSYGESENIIAIKDEYEKIDELPFDFVRKRLSVVVKDKKGKKFLICKGAVDKVVDICSRYELNNELHALEKEVIKKISNIDVNFSEDGFRVIAVAYKEIENDRKDYTMTDEAGLVFAGFMTFFDPPKESAAPAIANLKEHGIDIKVLTGDNELVTKKVCRDVNLDYSKILVGNQIEQMSERELIEEAAKTTIFARLSPEHKKRVVQALKHKGHVVGYLGDGINDAPALRASDVGISVDTAVDIAKESADIILLELSLLVLSDGVIEGRKVFGNIIKYIKMGASSNFGNMFSVLGASIFLPFLPMTPIQLITNNLLYDISQTAIPTDMVDEEYIEKPRKWQIKDIARFMVFIGPMSSIFDYSTFFMMLYIFNAWKQPALFQTGWFVESLLTQTLIVHVIRSRKIPFIQTWASKPLLLMTTTIMLIGILLTMSPAAPTLGFVRLPLLYWPLLILTLVLYVTVTQLMKMWYIKKYGYN